jgi:hypothetical protein
MLSNEKLVRQWLANAFTNSAAWRDEKAQEYPDDPRNAHSVEALLSAATYVQKIDESMGIRLMCSFERAASESGNEVADAELVGLGLLPGSESQRIVGRYFFFPGDELPDATAHEELLRELYEACLHDAREWDVDEDSPLGQLVEPAEPEPTEQALKLLTEIRDLLRDRLPRA